MRRLKRLALSTLLAGALSTALAGSALAFPDAGARGAGGLATAACAIATNAPHGVAGGVPLPAVDECEEPGRDRRDRRGRR